MAQMFSSGVTPDYLKTLADAYAQYFPQQAPVNTQALQQWYSPNGYSPDGSSAFAAPMGASAPSVVGSLFGDQYPQVSQGTRGSDRQPMSQAQQDFFNNETPEARDVRMSQFSDTLGSLLGGAATYGLLGPLPALAMKVYNYARPYGTAPSMSDAGLAAAISGQDAANARDSAPSFGGGDGGGGAATGGNGGDASGGGDRGTRGGF